MFTLDLLHTVIDILLWASVEQSQLQVEEISEWGRRLFPNQVNKFWFVIFVYILVSKCLKFFFSERVSHLGMP